MGIMQLTSTTNSKITLDISLSSSWNYPTYQADSFNKIENGNLRSTSFSFLKKISIENHSLSSFSNCVARFSVTPAYCSIDPIQISYLEKDKITEIDHFVYSVDCGSLYALNASVPGKLAVEIVSEDGDVIATKTIDFIFDPISNSLGREAVEELVASYVTPSDEEIEKIKDEAKIELDKKYHSTFGGYSYHDPNKIIEELDAVYLAIIKRNLSLSMGAETPEECLSRVKLPYKVLKEGSGNCVDFCILFASIVENISLRPILVFTKEKPLVGIYLDETLFGTPVLDNGTELLNLASKGFNRLMLVDPACFSKEKSANFSSATEIGYRVLENSRSFLYAVDIYASRKDHLLPLPTPTKVGKETQIIFPDFLAKKDYSTPVVDVEERRYLAEDSPSRKNKFDYWEEKLLDLSMNNRLINMKFSPSFPQALNLDSEVLLSYLSKNEKMSIFVGENVALNIEERHAPSSFPNSENNRFKEFLNKKTLYFSSKEGDTDSYLKNLARKANTAIEESGCNPLFLTIGIIKWFDNEKAAIHGKGAIYSPLFLLPVKMPRRRIGSTYTIEYNFDDLELNTTIFEYFHENFDLDFAPVFGALPKKANGEVDIRVILNFIRECIAPFKGWAVLESPCSLALFSFARFVMWNDIKSHREKMMENKIVSSFVNGFGDYPVLNTGKKEDFDQTLSSSSLAIPLPADSSQIEAIHASAMGASFILDGPPGTGKSQTIANMITNALYHGKSVLFVAEKGVALEVVKKRLDSLGIGQFCLSIPSINTAKSDILNSLGKMLDIGPIERPESFEKDSSSLDEARDALNHDLFALHNRDKYVMSTYEAIISYLKLRSYAGFYETSHEYSSSLTLESFEEAKKKLKNLSLQASSLGGYYGNAFLPFASRDYSLKCRDSLFEELPSLINDLKAFHLAVYNCFFKDKGLVETKKNVECYARIVEILQKNSIIYQDFLDNEQFVSKADDLRCYLDLLLHKNQIQESLLEHWENGFLKESGEALIAKLNALNDANIFEKYHLYNSLKKKLKPFAKDKNSLKRKNLQSSFASLSELNSLEKQIENADPFAVYAFGKTSLRSVADVEAARASYERTLDVITLRNKMRPAKSYSMTDIDKAIRHLATDGSYLFSNARASFLKERAELKEKLINLKEKYQFDLDLYQDSTDYYQHAASSLSDAISSKGRLSQWSSFLSVMDETANYVPAELIILFKEGKIKETDLLSAYVASLSYRILSDGLSESGLATLNSKLTEEQISLFKKAIDDFCKTSVIETASRITSLYPSNGSSAPSTETYQFRKLVKNGGRGVSLRQIFDHYGRLIRTLCPCFLMSPITVAQYLDINTYSFDVVIFDEASQIPTSEAIGAIARGKSVIIAGDQEQMPPTSFFVANGGHAYDGTILNSVSEDLESLLDDSIALGLPRERLIWHYRSRHEALIAFSNNKFYDNSLFTFPSAVNEKSSVKSIYVGGTYEIKRGVNRKEASMIVDEIARRLKNPKLSSYSIGVVTFNEAQQNLIEDLIEKKIPSYESKNPGGETIFVKNLENVQGDERDVILFSTTYAPKDNGKLSLNFGPLSREKGERRLNVAITRAREEMIVFTSMKPEDIESDKAKNAGASYLKSFLLFAEHGTSILPNNVRNHISSSSTSIADFIAVDLKKLGYDVKTNVGSSSFKVDVAVTDPTNKNHYSLGILVDGDSYCSSPTCRDRNIVEPGVLKQLGWNLYRVWSVEYLDHPQEVIKNIVKAINSKNKVEDKVIQQVSPSGIPFTFKKKEAVSHPYAIPYLAYHEDSSSPLLQIDFSNKTEAARFLKGFVENVIYAETPISAHLLDERIREAYQLTRIGSNARDVINSVLRQLAPNKEMLGGVTFYWDKGHSMSEYRYYRLNDENQKREISDISFIELGNAIADILLEQGKMTVLDLFKQVSILFGFSSLKEKSRKHLDLALKANVNQRLDIVREDDYVFIKGRNG